MDLFFILLKILVFYFFFFTGVYVLINKNNFNPLFYIGSSNNLAYPPGRGCRALRARLEEWKNIIS